jgi:hypothetical protein
VLCLELRDTYVIRGVDSSHEESMAYRNDKRGGMIRQRATATNEKEAHRRCW